MDTKHFELLLRETPFCRALLAEVWDGLTTKERIDLLLHFADPLGSGVPKEVQAKALDDQSPVVRMLAAKHIYERVDPELYAKAAADHSAFVKAAVKGIAREDPEHMLSMSQLERLGAIALSAGVDGESFAKFIGRRPTEQRDFR